VLAPRQRRDHVASRARHGDAQAIRVDRLEHVVHSVNVEARSACSSNGVTKMTSGN